MWYIRDAGRIPETVNIWTANGGDGGSEDDAAPDERTPPYVYVSANREEEQMLSSGIYELTLTVSLSATDQQLSKRQFSSTFRELVYAIEAAKTHGLDNGRESTLKVYSLENLATGDTEEEEGMRTKEFTIQVFATRFILPDGRAALVTEDQQAVIVTEG